MIKVMVVDDQLLLKQTLLYMLSQDDEIEAIDGGKDGYEAIEKTKELLPNVILMDLRMPRMGGLTAMTQIKAQFPSVKVMVLTTFEDDQSIFKSLEAGADGYLVKDIKPEELIMAVKAVNHNLYTMHANVLAVLKQEISRITKERKTNHETINNYGLTVMEIRVIKEMVNGKSNKEIAEKLNFTEGTVKNKVSKILAKCGLKDRTQLAVFAIKHNLL